MESNNSPTKVSYSLKGIVPKSISERDPLLTFALSVKASEYPERLYWAQENNFAIEYTPDPLAPELISPHVSSFIQDGIPVRYHTRFFDFELGNSENRKAAEALEIHKNVVDAIKELGEQVLTVHLNLNKKIIFSEDNAVSNLIALTDYAKGKGVTVCLENLKKGPSSYPGNILNWANQANSMITMDMGHAISSDYVSSGQATVPEIVDLFSPKLFEVHMYGREEDRHYPIEDMATMGRYIDRLLGTACRWWTIELDNYVEALNTRRLILEYLDKSRKEF